MAAVPPPAAILTVAELAQEWATVASRTTYLPMSGEELEQFLADLITRLVDAVVAPEVDEQAAFDVATQLVRHDLTGSLSMGRSIEVLGAGLPQLDVLQQHPGELHTALLCVLGALANGYAEALRQRTFDEQEMVKRALFKAKLDAERELRVSEARFREIFSASAVGIVISDLDGVLVDANQAFADLVGRSLTNLKGLSLRGLLHAEGDVELGEAYRELTAGIAARFRREHRLVTPGGETAWTYLVGSVLRDADGVPTHHITIVEDITELRLLQQELSDQALHDMLTGLPNEHYFMSHLQDVLEGADPSAMVTLCRVNLDGFSVINDGIGRVAGQRLLCSVARRLQSLVTEERAMVARMGTDDFAILIEEGPQTPDLRLFPARINDELAEPFYVDDRGLAVSAGVGMVRRRAGGISAGELIRAADATLHRVKRGGRGQWGLYDAQADAEERDNYRLAAEIPGAFENGEISMTFQPVYCLELGQLVAAQALLRWDRADGTVVEHRECLALAEQTGLVLTVGRWMLQEACAKLSSWSAEHGAGPLLLRIDLTTRLSQDPDLAGIVREALSATGVPAECLRIGMPLAGLAGDREEVVDNANVLADLGAGVGLLDTTADPGCLTYVEDLPVIAVEIAPQIVSRLAQCPGENSLLARGIRYTIPLLHDFGVLVLVPGVDTAAQAQWWRAAGADAARGTHFNLPADR